MYRAGSRNSFQDVRPFTSTLGWLEHYFELLQWVVILARILLQYRKNVASVPLKPRQVLINGVAGKAGPGT